ncbi:MAG: urease subunit beta [Ferruginibacter sp.]|nr:urease subunit beta [Ferruginibacter sp.]
MIPGEYILKSEPILANQGRITCKITVVNTGDRPVQIGSHYHFFEVNKEMSFERESSFGMRLNIPAGTAVRFEPGERKEIELVEFGGDKIIYGFNDLTNGVISEENKKKALAKSIAENFKNEIL